MKRISKILLFTFAMFAIGIMGVKADPGSTNSWVSEVYKIDEETVVFKVTVDTGGFDTFKGSMEYSFYYDKDFLTFIKAETDNDINLNLEEESNGLIITQTYNYKPKKSDITYSYYYFKIPKNNGKYDGMYLYFSNSKNIVTNYGLNKYDDTNNKFDDRCESIDTASTEVFEINYNKTPYNIDFWGYTEDCLTTNYLEPDNNTFITINNGDLKLKSAKTFNLNESDKNPINTDELSKKTRDDLINDTGTRECYSNFNLFGKKIEMLSSTAIFYLLIVASVLFVLFIISLICNCKKSKKIKQLTNPIKQTNEGTIN